MLPPQGGDARRRRAEGNEAAGCRLLAGCCGHRHERSGTPAPGSDGWPGPAGGGLPGGREWLPVQRWRLRRLGSGSEGHCPAAASASGEGPEGAEEGGGAESGGGAEGRAEGGGEKEREGGGGGGRRGGGAGEEREGGGGRREGPEGKGNAYYHSSHGKSIRHFAKCFVQLLNLHRSLRNTT